MEISPNKHFMSVSEALSVFKKNKYIVENAVLDILKQCNIPITNTSRGRIKRKLIKEKDRRRHAGRNGGMPKWLSDAAQEEFCPHMPPEDTAPAPALAPVTVPTHAPTPVPALKPVPAPALLPVTAPALAPIAAPTHAPEPAPALAPAPASAPALAPVPAPTHAPAHMPVPAPAPALALAFAPAPAPEEDEYEDCVEDQFIEDLEDEDYVPPTAPKTGGRPKAPLSHALGRTTLQRRVDGIIPALQEIADSENTALMPFLVIVLVILCCHSGWKKLTKLLYSIFIDIDRSD